MSLSACVYCDCLERNKVSSPLPSNATVRVGADGYPSLVCNGRTIDEDDPDWENFRCEHELRMLMFKQLGNISMIGLIRAELESQPARFPTLLGKVVYNGTHGGDWLPVQDFSALESELAALKHFECRGNLPESQFSRLLWKWFKLGKYHYTDPKESALFVAEFRDQMSELLSCARTVGKPICF